MQKYLKKGEQARTNLLPDKFLGTYLEIRNIERTRAVSGKLFSCAELSMNEEGRLKLPPLRLSRRLLVLTHGSLVTGSLGGVIVVSPSLGVIS